MVKNPPANAEDARVMGLILGLERSPGVGNGKLQYSCQENCVDRDAWWAAVRGVTEESDTTDHACTRTYSGQQTESQI